MRSTLRMSVPLILVASLLAAQGAVAARITLTGADAARPEVGVVETSVPGTLETGGAIGSALNHLGVDFGYPGGRSHARGAPDEMAVSSETCRFTVRDCEGEPLPTDINLLGYLRDLEDWVQAHPEVRVVKRGRRGAAIRGVPCVEGPDA